jgi:DNA invertase Pin-like site-specific DNA recombinase
MLIGYARVSPTDRDSALQLHALKAAQCERIFVDEGAGAATIRRPALDDALATLKAGDLLIVWKVDRLGRSLSHLIRTTKQLGDAGIGFRSLTESIDTTSAQGCLYLHFIDALAEFERALVAERTKAGAAMAKQRGARVGRRPKFTPDLIDQARRLIDAGESPRHVAKTMGVSIATLYRKIPAAASNRDILDLFSGMSS